MVMHVSDSPSLEDTEMWGHKTDKLVKRPCVGHAQT